MQIADVYEVKALINLLKLLARKVKNLFSDKKFNEILTGSVWSFGAQIIATLCAMLTSIVIARYYGAEMMGTVAVIDSFMMLVTIFTVIGTNTSILRLIPEHISKHSTSSAYKVYRKIFFLVICLSLVTGSALFLVSDFVSNIVFSKPKLQYFLSLSSIFIVFRSLMDLNTQAVRGLRKVRIFAFMQVLPHVARLLVLVSVTLFFFNQGNPVYAILTSFGITGLFGSWAMFSMFKKQIKVDDIVNDMPLKDIISISAPMLMTATMAFIISQTGIFILGIFHPESEVGYYSVAVKLAALTSFILSAVNSMAGPKFSELYHSGNVDELFHVARKSAKLIFWTTIPILFILIVFGRPVIALLFGTSFTVAYPPMVILILGQFVNSVSGATGLFMNMTGYQNVFKNIVFISALSNIGLNALLSPKYGIYGAAIAGMVSMMVWNVATLIYIKRKFGRTTGYFPYLSGRGI